MDLAPQVVCDPELIISDPGKTLAEGAITPSRRGTKRMHITAIWKRRSSTIFILMKTCRSANCRSNSNKRCTSAQWSADRMDFGQNREAKVAEPFEGLVPQRTHRTFFRGSSRNRKKTAEQLVTIAVVLNPAPAPRGNLGQMIRGTLASLIKGGRSPCVRPPRALLKRRASGGIFVQLRI